MNHVYLIGNGFDIAHKLDSSYSDFLLWYLQRLWSDLFAIRSTSSGDYLHSDDLVHIHIPSSLFSTISSQGPSKITSIHEFYEWHFDNVYHPKKTTEPKNENPLWYLGSNTKTPATLAPKINVNFSQFMKRLLCEHQWRDVERIYFEELKNASDSTWRTDIIHSINTLNRGLETIKTYLIKYLEEKVQRKINHPIYNGVISEILKPESVEDKQLFINFNYTNTLTSLYLDEQNTNQRVINIHGSINNEMEPIIFGYGDDEDKAIDKLRGLEIKEALDNLKHLCRFDSTSYVDTLNEISKFSEYKVHIVGHSLGLTDRYILKDILNTSKCVKIEFHYYTDNKKDNFRELLKSLEDILPDIDRQIITPKPLCKPFPKKS